MTVAEIEEARKRWIAERPFFVNFSERVENDLKAIVRAQGISAEVSARAKEVHSLVKKLLAKTKHTYDSLPDKVGVRIVVRYRSDLPILLKAIGGTFAFKAPQDKSSMLGNDRVGYLSIHVDKLRYIGPVAKEFPPRRFFAELQLRTLAQHLWAEVSHDAFYKNNELIQALPKDLRRRVNLVAGLVEVADREIDTMNSLLPNIPGAHLFKGLESLYYRLTAVKPNINLSLEVIELLLPLYRGESEEEIMQRHVSPTFAAHEATLRHVYSDPDGDYSNASAFLFQPEALLLYDRLQNDPDGTLAVWNSKFPPKELERVAIAFGLSLD